MDVRAGTQLALLAAVQALLEAEVVELALEAGVLGVPVVLPQDGVLELLGPVNDDLAHAPDAAAQLIGLVLDGNLPRDEVRVGRIGQHREEMA